MAVYPLDPSKSVHKKDAKHFKEDDSGEDIHALTEQPSSYSTEVKPLSAGQQDVESLEKDNHWAMEKLEALTLETKREDANNGWHGSFFLGKSQEPCS